jgi:hypothetical protein
MMIVPPFSTEASSAFARSEDVDGGELDLERRNPVNRARWCPDLGREIGHGGEVVAQDRGRVREPIAGQLHPVTRVTGEPDDDALLLLDLLGHIRSRASLGGLLLPRPASSVPGACEPPLVCL